MNELQKSKSENIKGALFNLQGIPIEGETHEYDYQKRNVRV